MTQIVSNHLVPSSLRASHRIIKKASLFLLCAFFTCACAKQDPLSTVQKDQILETLQSAGRAYNAARANIHTPSQTQSSSTDATDQVLRQMTGALVDRIKARDCRIRIIAPDSYRIESVQGIKRTFALLRVWGENHCPINLDFRIGTLLEPSIGRWAISYDYSYSATDPSFQRLNDVDAIELHGGMSINGTDTDEVRSEINFKGSIHSQALGNISLESFGKLVGESKDLLSGETTLTFSYADFDAEFIKKYNHGQVSYTLNHENFDIRDFNRYFAQGGDPFIYVSNTSLIH